MWPSLTLTQNGIWWHIVTESPTWNFMKIFPVRFVLYLDDGSDKTRLIVSSDSCFVHVVDNCTVSACWLNTHLSICINEVTGNTALKSALKSIQIMEDCIWNVTAHAQKPEFIFCVKWMSPFKLGGASVQSTASSRGVRISSDNARYTMFLGSVKSTGYPLHSPVSPSLPLPCDTVCHHISTGLYLLPNDTVLAARTI